MSKVAFDTFVGMPIASFSLSKAESFSHLRVVCVPVLSALQLEGQEEVSRVLRVRLVNSRGPGIYMVRRVLKDVDQMYPLMYTKSRFMLSHCIYCISGVLIDINVRYPLPPSHHVNSRGPGIY